MNTYTYKDISSLFLFWANTSGDVLTNLKLQKLLYYAQAWFLVHFKTTLFDSNIEAWEYGPVVPDAYTEFKTFNRNPIEYSATKKEESIFEKEKLEVLDSVYCTYVKYSAHELVNITHNEKPWIEAYKSQDKIITPEAMKSYYSDLLKTSA